MPLFENAVYLFLIEQFYPVPRVVISLLTYNCCHRYHGYYQDSENISFRQTLSSFGKVISDMTHDQRF